MKNRIKKLRIDLIALVISIVALIYTILRSQGLSICTINEELIMGFLKIAISTALSISVIFLMGLFCYMIFRLVTFKDF